MKIKNRLLMTDVYNISHTNLKQSVDFEVSHMYNRSKGMYLFGLSEIISDYLSTPISKAEVEEAYEISKKFGLDDIFPLDMFYRLVDELGGNLPLKIESLPEGTWCPMGTPFAQVSNTVEGYGELVTWFEAVFMKSYFASECFTRAVDMRKYLEITASENNLDKDSFITSVHSFGYRGHKSEEDAYYAGKAWVSMLPGTDDFNAGIHGMPVTSIQALAHKVTQQYDEEIDCFYNAIDSASNSKKPVVALVIDTYNAWKVIEKYLSKLAAYAVEKNVFIVLRPDSGDVFEQAYRIVELAVNNNWPVGVIVGEGMTFDKVKDQHKQILKMGLPLDKFSWGVGAGFYKDIERDTSGWSMKTGYSNHSPRMKFSENPIKRSIPGEVAIIMTSKNELMVVQKNEIDQNSNIFKTIYLDGCIQTDEVDTLQTISRRALEQPGSQRRIRISEKTSILIEGFKDKYL